LGPVDEADLHAFVDGRLGEERRAAVAEWLEARPEERRRVADWQRHNELIGQLWGQVALEPLPARLAVDRLVRRLWRRRALATAAGVMLLLGAGAAGWVARELMPPAAEPAIDPIAQLAGTGVEAHRMFVAEKRHAVEVSRDEEQHLVTWLSNRLGRPLRVPDLGGFGLQLLGGRLLPTHEGGPAAQLMYEDASGARLTVYVTRGRGQDTAFRILERGNITAFYWLDRDTAYAVIGSAPRERLLAICQAIYDQMEARPT
jgi:anti-sigma factor RsiW